MSERKDEINEFENLVKQVAPNYVVEGVKYVWQTLEFSILWGIHLGDEYAVDRGTDRSGWKAVTQTPLLDEEWEEIVEELFSDENYDDLLYVADTPYDKFDKFFVCNEEWFEEADFQKIRINLLMPENAIDQLNQALQTNEMILRGTYYNEDFEFNASDYARTFGSSYQTSRWIDVDEEESFEPEYGVDNLEVSWKLVNGKLI